MEKKKFLVFLLAALLSNSSPASPKAVAKGAISDNFLGSIPFQRKPTDPGLGPFNVLSGKDGSLLVTAFGSLLDTDSMGQIWRAGPSDTELALQMIQAESGNRYGELTGSAVDPNDPTRLFACSNFIRVEGQDQGVARKRMVVVSPPTVVVFHTGVDGSYVWQKAINLPNLGEGNTQYCTRLVISGGYLFVLNSYEKKITYPAIDYIPLTKTEELPADMKIAANYEQLGFQEDSDKFPVTDLAPLVKKEDPKSLSLFFLDSYHHAIGRVHFKILDSGELAFSQLGTPFRFSPQDIPQPIAFVNYNDSSFLVSSTTDSMMSASQITQLIYSQRKSASSPEVYVIAEPPVPVISLSIGDDRFGLTENKVLFANMMKPVDGQYRVDEYKFRTCF